MGYKIHRDGYVHSVIVEKAEVERIRVLYDGGKKKRLSVWQAEYGPDILINGALFEGDGRPIETFRSGGVTVGVSDWCKEGAGILSDEKTVAFGTYDERYTDFVVGFPVLIRDNKKAVNFDVGSGLSGRNPRSVFSETETEYIFTAIDGRQADAPGKTIDETAGYLTLLGVKNAINLDGGGSTRLMADGEVVNHPTEDRAVSSVIAVWLKKGETGDKPEGGSKMKICIDAGHNDHGADTGAEGNGLREQDITYPIAHALAEKLRASGATVFETRPTKETILGTSLNSSLQARCDAANQNNVDYFISIHCNAATSSSANGTETYIYSESSAAKPVAQAVQSKIVERLKTTNRGVKTGNLMVLRNTVAPALLVETAFISNPDNAKLLREKQAEFTEAIYEGMCEALGLEKQSEAARGNQFSFDDTVEMLVQDGIIYQDENLWANIANWEQMLLGKAELNPDYVRELLRRYHEKLRG